MRILLVEDEKSVSSFVSKGLSQQGYSVQLAEDGAEALRRIMSEEYDLVILDILLPVLNGFEVLKQVRQGGVDVPVLVLTARDQVADRIEGLNLGADDYMVKPFMFAELAARVEAIMRRSKRQGKTILQVADLEMNPLEHTVHRAGERIDLTPKEFALLQFLLENAGRVQSRARIVENVWDMNFDGDLSVVDVFIRYLRRKVDEPFEEKVIETVRGVGYVIAKS